MQVTVPEGFNREPLFPKSVFFSVHNSEKPGLEERARALMECGVKTVYASGGTAKYLVDHGIPVIDFNLEVTGKPGIMSPVGGGGHRVATLGYESAGAILARRNVPVHMTQLGQFCQGKSPTPVTFDIVAVSIYPFQETISTEEVDFLNAIENIDIGGPTLLREAAKNHEWVVPIPGMTNLDWLLASSGLREGRGIGFKTRLALAARTFEIISRYDHSIQDFLYRVNQQL